MTVHEMIGAVDLHERGIDGRGVGVAVVDTGVTPVNALRGRVRPGVDLSGAGGTEDAYGHGTAVAGLIAGGLIGNRPVGIAPGAHIVAVRVAGPDGATDVSNVLAGIQWAVSHAEQFDIRIITLTAGTDAETSWRSGLLNRAVQRARDAGLLVVVSVGNRGPQRGTVPNPADDPHVLSVGAADTRGTPDPHDDRIATFSSRGPVTDEGVVKPDVLAPGVDVTTLRVTGSFVDRSYPSSGIDHQRVRSSGASFAMATVAGGAALLLQVHPGSSPDEIRSVLIETAARRPLGESGAVGRGVIDVGAAAQQDAIEVSTPPAVAAREPVDPIGRSRGTLSIAVGPADDPIVLDAGSELTAQGQPFDAASYLEGPWTEGGWSSGQWASQEWLVPRWHRRADDQAWYAVSWG